MSVTFKDLFCGAGGSTVGVEQAGGHVAVALNHWPVATDLYSRRHPNTRTDCADVSQADPRRYVRTDVLIASPECTNHSQARGVSRKRQHPDLFDSADLSAERSRATMWDVVRFTEQMRYAAVIVENVVEAAKWVLFPSWCQAMESLGYTLTLLSHNAMDAGVAQSRDRIFAVWLRNGIKADLEFEHVGYCGYCERVRPCRQAWKNGRRVGRYRQQWMWACVECHLPVQPAVTPAEDVLDWSLPCPPLGAKKRAESTRMRVWAGMVRHGWVPITTTGSGHGYETTPGNRARPLTEPIPTVHTSGGRAVATPPGFLFNTAHGGRITELDQPHPTVCASDDRAALVLTNRTHAVPRGVDEPLTTLTAGGNHHGLITRTPLLVRGSSDSGKGEMSTPVTEPARTFTAKAGQAVVTPPSTPEEIATLDSVGFRQVEPYEAAGFQAFPDNYIPRDLPKVHQMRLVGNAVPPPMMRRIVERVIQALETAA